MSTFISVHVIEVSMSPQHNKIKPECIVEINMPAFVYTKNPSRAKKTVPQKFCTTGNENEILRSK